MNDVHHTAPNDSASPPQDSATDTKVAKPLSPYIKSRGLKFPRDPKIMTPKLRRLLRQNRYEAREADAVQRLLRPGDVVLELGGGIGYMSALVGNQRRIQEVHSFEANPDMVPYIRRVYAANGITKAHITNAILGSRKGTANFYVRPNFSGSSLEPREDDDPEEIVVHKIEVLNAKQVMAKIAPSFLICDIEGAEAQLLPAMDLGQLRAAVVELHPQWIGKEGVNNVFRAFMDAGMAYHAKASDGKVVTFRRDI